MATRRNIQREISAALNKFPDGLSLIEIGCVIGADYETVRTTMQRARPAGIYIDKWVRISQGPHSAIYKIVPVPPDAERPPRSTDEPVSARGRPRLARLTEEEKRRAALPSQGLTQIRGPWPTH